VRKSKSFLVAMISFKCGISVRQARHDGEIT
jgi:hypothetical protein